MSDGTSTFHLAPCGRGHNFLANECELRNLGEGVVRCKDVKIQRCEAVINNKLAICHPELGSGSQEMLKLGCQSDVQEILKRVQDDINIFLKRTYSHINLFSYSPHKRAAFTLAEVLITLGIIGVVAAMTLPVLISKYQERSWLTSFKRTYSVLYQAYLGAYQENGIASTWCPAKNSDCSKTYFDILSPHLKVVEIWGFDRPDILYQVTYKDLDGSEIKSNNAFPTTHYKFVLNDGTIIGIGYDGDLNMPLLDVDTNGLKGPNQFGKDLFHISLNSKNNYPVISGFAKWWMYDNLSCATVKAGGAGTFWSGAGCSLWIISTGNMDYLHRNLTLDEWHSAVKNLLVDLYKDSLDK